MNTEQNGMSQAAAKTSACRFWSVTSRVTVRVTENSVGYPASASLVSYTVEASDGDLSNTASLIGGCILPIVEKERIHPTI